MIYVNYQALIVPSRKKNLPNANIVYTTSGNDFDLNRVNVSNLVGSLNFLRICIISKFVYLMNNKLFGM